MNIHSLYRIIFQYFRPKRMRQFWRDFRLAPQTRVLDVGGTWYNWSLLSQQPCLTILNLKVPQERNQRAAWLVADARYLPFRDRSFEVVYSNSVIEHLENIHNQRLFAAGCQRVGRHYYVQTPNKHFQIEPHLITPFIHWLPRELQRRMLRNMTVWGLVNRPNQQRCAEFMREIRLLDETEMRGLFPDAHIWRERILGITKSIIAVRN
jgi:hypothetical protein